MLIKTCLCSVFTWSRCSWTWSPVFRLSAAVTWWTMYPPARTTASTGYRTSWETENTHLESDLTWTQTGNVPTMHFPSEQSADLQSIPCEVAAVMWLPPLLRVEAGLIQDDTTALTLSDLWHQTLTIIQSQDCRTACWEHWEENNKDYLSELDTEGQVRQCCQIRWWIQLQFFWRPPDAAVIKLWLYWSECENLQLLYKHKVLLLKMIKPCLYKSIIWNTARLKRFDDISQLTSLTISLLLFIGPKHQKPAWK